MYIPVIFLWGLAGIVVADRIDYVPVDRFVMASARGVVWGAVLKMVAEERFHNRQMFDVASSNESFARNSSLVGFVASACPSDGKNDIEDGYKCFINGSDTSTCAHYEDKQPCQLKHAADSGGDLCTSLYVCAEVSPAARRRRSVTSGPPDIECSDGGMEFTSEDDEIVFTYTCDTSFVVVSFDMEIIPDALFDDHFKLQVKSSDSTAEYIETQPNPRPIVFKKCNTMNICYDIKIEIDHTNGKSRAKFTITLDATARKFSDTTTIKMDTSATTDTNLNSVVDMYLTYPRRHIFKADYRGVVLMINPGSRRPLQTQSLDTGAQILEIQYENEKSISTVNEWNFKNNAAVGHLYYGDDFGDDCSMCTFGDYTDFINRNRDSANQHILHASNIGNEFPAIPFYMRLPWGLGGPSVVVVCAQHFWWDEDYKTKGHSDKKCISVSTMDGHLVIDPSTDLDISNKYDKSTKITFRASFPFDAKAYVSFLYATDNCVLQSIAVTDENDCDDTWHALGSLCLKYGVLENDFLGDKKHARIHSGCVPSESQMNVFCEKKMAVARLFSNDQFKTIDCGSA